MKGSKQAEQMVTDLSCCTAQLDDGSVCGQPSAASAPFPICDGHVVAAYRFVKRRIGGLSEDPAYRVHRYLDRVDEDCERERQRFQDRQHVIYYVRIGDHIKIGYTSCLKQRMTQYPLNRRLLAVETGDLVTERARHLQFRAYLALGKEWFTPGAELLSHINLLRLGYGSEPVHWGPRERPLL